MGQPQANSSDDFPPLSRNINGDIGQDRVLQSFGAVHGHSGFGSGIGNNLSGGSNGLLNALSSSSRAPPGQAQATSPTSLGGMLRFLRTWFIRSNPLAGPSASRSPVETSRMSLTEQENVSDSNPLV